MAVGTKVASLESLWLALIDAVSKMSPEEKANLRKGMLEDAKKALRA